MVLSKGLLPGLCICLYTLLPAQLPPASFHHLGKDEERLMFYGFHCLAEDRFGFIWFGSWHGGGLYRFDGYDLRSFFVDPEHPGTSLTSNHINTLTL